MPTVSFRFNPIAFAIGGFLIAIGAGIPAFLPPDHNPWSLPSGAAIFLAGVFLSSLGLVVFSRASVRFLDLWDSSRLYKAIGRAGEKTVISVLQISVPEPAKLIGELERQLINEGKQFKLRILLINYKTARELVAARVRLRIDKADDHLQEIQANIKQFIELKNRIDRAWKESHDGATLKLEIGSMISCPLGRTTKLVMTLSLSAFSGIPRLRLTARCSK